MFGIHTARAGLIPSVSPKLSAAESNPQDLPLALTMRPTETPISLKRKHAKGIENLRRNSIVRILCLTVPSLVCLSWGLSQLWTSPFYGVGKEAKR
jgi:hypothetical protein